MKMEIDQHPAILPHPPHRDKRNTLSIPDRSHPVTTPKRDFD